MDDYLYRNSDVDDYHRINPATGLPMIGVGVDAGGNAYGDFERSMFIDVGNDEYEDNNNGVFILVGAIIIFAIIFFG
jgi:hypothetical protein